MLLSELLLYGAYAMDLCVRCSGTGKYRDHGFMIVDCTLCDEDSTSEIPLAKINRKSASYKKAIKDIMAINPDISREDAVKMFDEAYVKD